ncbi:MAG: helix-turn-helix domain-containing protein [Holdemanella porci]
MEKAFKYRIYPNREQRILLAKTFGCTRFVYNHYLAKRKDAYEKDGITLSYSACAKDQVSLKKEYEWLKEVDSVALQSSVKNLNTAYINFFRKKLNILDSNRRRHIVIRIPQNIRMEILNYMTIRSSSLRLV